MSSMDELNKIWTAVYDSMRADFSESSLELWFGSVRLFYLSNELALLSHNVDFKYNIIKSKYIDLLKEHFENCLGFEIEVDIVFTKQEIRTIEEANALAAKYFADKKISDEEEDRRELEAAIRVISPDTAIDGKKSTSYYTFENFISGDSNKFSYAACYAIANSDEVAYNPLFVHGKSGLGKTHLMYAIVNSVLSRDPNMKIVYIRGEEFTNKLVEAIKSGTTEQFREKYRTADMLLVDDIQFIAGKNATQDEFFHTFNALYESQKQIIVTCDRPIKEMKNLEDRIKTRLEWGLSADIQPPDTELRMAIIRKKAEEVNLKLPEEVVEFLAKRLSDNVRKIEGGVKKLSAFHFLSGEEIDLPLAARAVSDLLPADEPKSARIEKVILAVCDKYNISKETILGKKRTNNIVTARHVCMYALREAVDMTFKDIGEVFSCDHTSVMSATRKIERERAADPEFSAETDALIRELKEKTP